MRATKEGGRSSDTMGSKNLIKFGVYKVCGSMNCYFSEKTGFNDEDANAIKEALLSLFENDLSSARPEGSMNVEKIIGLPILTSLVSHLRLKYTI